MTAPPARLRSQVLDTTSTVCPDWHQLKEVALFLTQPNVLPPDQGLALYVSIGGADWSYRGYVSNAHPSEVLPLSWPEPGDGVLAGLAAPPPGFAQVGVSLEPLGELGQKEGSKLGAKEDFVKAVGLDLFNYMQVRCAGALWGAVGRCECDSVCGCVGGQAHARSGASRLCARPGPPPAAHARPPRRLRPQSFGALQAMGGDRLLDAWFQKLINRLHLDPDYLTRRKDVV